MLPRVLFSGPSDADLVDFISFVRQIAFAERHCDAARQRFAIAAFKFYKVINENDEASPELVFTRCF